MTTYNMFGITLIALLFISFAMFTSAQDEQGRFGSSSSPPSASRAPSVTATRSKTNSPSHTPSFSPWPSSTPSRTATISKSPSRSPTISVTSSITPTISITPSPSPCSGYQTVQQCKVAQVYNNLLVATEILSGALSVADLFSPTVVGRVDPVGTFDSYKLLTEYFYALAANPQTYITEVTFIDLFGEGAEVYVRVNVLFEPTQYFVSTGQPFNISQKGRYVFNSDNLIETVDVTIPYLGKHANPEFNRPVYTLQQTELIAEVCAALVVGIPQFGVGPYCPEQYDPTGYYTSEADCIDFMTNNITYGTWDDAQANSFVCRQLHSLLTAYDPVTHCPHCGKTGGGKCVDWDYEEYFAESFRKRKGKY